MLRHSTLGLLLALFVASCSSSFPLDSSPRGAKMRSLGYLPVPLTKPTGSDKRPGVKVRVNGQPTTLLLDSGANSTRISQSFARKAGVKVDKNNTATSRGALGRKVRVYRGSGNLEIGPLSLSPYTFSINPDEARATAVGRFPGHLGAESLKATGALIDMSSSTLWVPSRKAVNVGRGNIRPLSKHSDLGIVSQRIGRASTYYHLILKGIIKGRTVNFIIDTGAEVSLLTRSSARKLGLRVAETRSRMLDAHGDYSSLGATTAPTARFGGFLARNLPLSVADIPAFNSSSLRAPGGAKIDGILGIDFLRQTDALIDAKSQIIYFGSPRPRP